MLRFFTNLKDNESISSIFRNEVPENVPAFSCKSERMRFIGNIIIGEECLNPCRDVRKSLLCWQCPRVFKVLKNY